eukprot:TRINITY_DN58643_c0_g1_i1.p1 TRINITY_DN58643_c0_g1~~TRINITY_DN58643_c0_g1_i1.p1  ORF type:complete len:551 (-),score=116.60 TRINITY_DN58643_c0_g1_i1:66-1718(-)
MLSEFTQGALTETLVSAPDRLAGFAASGLELIGQARERGVWLTAAELETALPKTWQGCVLLVSVLLVFWRCCCRSSGRTASAAPKVQAFAHWARTHIEQTPAEGHRQFLADVICEFATAAARLAGRHDANGAAFGAESVSVPDAVPPAVKAASEQRLRVLAEFLDAPTVASALRAAHWEWARSWETGDLSAEEAKLMFLVIMPTIQAAAGVHRGSLPASKQGGAEKTGASEGTLLQGHLRPLGVEYVACWCSDFLERKDVVSFLKGESNKGKIAQQASEEYSDYSQSDSEGDNDLEDDDDVRWRWASSMVPSKSSVPEWLPRQNYDNQPHSWSEPDARRMKVRGPRYLEDRVKVASPPAMLELVLVDICKATGELDNYATSPKCGVHHLRRGGETRFLFVVNFNCLSLHLAVILAVPDDPEWKNTPEGRLFYNFLEMSEEERNKRFKALPKIVEGPWLVTRVLPEKPGIIGKQNKMMYFRGDDYFEVSINCLTSPAAKHITTVLEGLANAFSVELFFIIEGQAPDELPERILGGMKVTRCDLASMPQRDV